MDVADLVDLVAAARVAAEDAVDLAKVALVDVEVIVQDAVFRAPVIVGVAVDVMGVILDVLDAVDIAKVALGVQDVEAHVQAHARQVEKARLVLHAIAAPDALVRVHHVHHVLDVVDAVDVQVDVADVLDVRPAAKVTVLPNVADAPVDAIPHVQDVQVDVRDVQVDVADVQDADLDAMAHVLARVMGVVMDVVVDVKTHVLLTAQQRALEHAKLKHSAL